MLLSFITALVIVKSNNLSLPSRIIVSVTFVPLSPLSILTAASSVISRVTSPSILTILSPASIPALKAGVSSIGDITVRILSLIPISIPMPPNSPFVSSVISWKLSGSRNWLYPSSVSIIPLIAPYTRSLTLIGFT